MVSDLVSVVTGDASVGSDTLRHIEGIRGTSFDDTFIALPGFAGDYGNSTTYEGGGGNDTIVGSGHTHVRYGFAAGAVAVDFATARRLVMQASGPTR